MHLVTFVQDTNNASAVLNVSQLSYRQHVFLLKLVAE